MQKVGYTVIDVASGSEIAVFGDTYGQCAGMPELIDLPNGDRVHCPDVNVDYGGVKLIERMKSPALAQVAQERARRLGLGFDYDFGNGRGVHRISTTPTDMAGWSEVTTLAQAAINKGQGAAPITIVTDTGPVTITANEWQDILIAAGAFRQPIWAKSFVLEAMNPIPDNYENDSYWT